ncbi:polyphosphate kinase 2 (PPK2 family) [Bacillus ectoiniformans]|uniref:polyphosphate kinase 2 family protein n=1 Tax=Bacillus ectoiniformans TaxID=1494429 RepID=UPI001958B8EE|nr:UDP-galactose-lipid carrier transferase [Bacillus ectoiniformans]MBM7650091.1 polyphosphate kinase 2 (PPK2 family) [Bacillus ectoiniformans]
MEINLRQMDLSKKVESKKDYKNFLKKFQYRLLSLQQLLFQEKIGLVIVMEGMDAAGKGGAIKRMTEKLDPRGLQVYPISAPQPHEKRYHYLQRFWRKLPQYGQIAIFDRSWYGRVIVERIEGFATKNEWGRAYQEINDFEKLLTEDDYLTIKFWVHISNDEQLARFEARKNDPLKQWKLTDEDWRNREKWELYEEAAEDMLRLTDTVDAPWHVIEGNDKKYARLAILQTLVNHIENQLTARGIPLPDYQLFEK